MRRQGGSGARWRVAVRAAAPVFAVLSLVVVVAGCVLVQVDDQYEASSVPGRIVVGVLGGLLAAAVLAPATAVISLAVGGWLGATQSRRGRHR